MDRKAIIIIAVLSVIAVAATIAAIVLGVQKSETSSSGPSTTTAKTTTTTTTTTTKATAMTPTTITTTSSSVSSTLAAGEAEWRRIDCYPEERWGDEEVTDDMCQARGCTYDPFVGTSAGGYVPSCYVINDVTSGDVISGSVISRRKRQAVVNQALGYRTESVTTTNQGVTITLKANGALFKDYIETVELAIEYKTKSALRIKLTDASKVRYEVPESVVKPNLPDIGDARFDDVNEILYDVRITNNHTFAFQIIRRSTNAVIWDTSVGGLVLADQYLSLSTRLPSSNIYGFGENSHESFRHDLNFRTWGMFARDQWVGTGPHNHYSVHPFYTCLEADGSSHGVLLLNSNAQDYTFTPLPMLTYRTIGGVLDFYFFFGPTPENVVQQYTHAIGLPYMPPYWGLGFQLCRYGYRNLTHMQQAVNRTIEAKIPLDIQYADIDHFYKEQVFTVDNANNDSNFYGLPEYFEYLRSTGMHTIIILDPCLITNQTDYMPYEDGKTIDGFIKWSSLDAMPLQDYIEAGNRTDMLGYVWPTGKVVFPDFFKKEMNLLWSNLINEHFSTIQFDGIWIDMNEPANFGTNDERPWNWPKDATPYWSLHCPPDPLDDPPYRTMATYVYDAEQMDSDTRGSPARLSDKTLCMTALQGDSGEYKHYDVHNLYGASQIEATLEGLRRTTNATKRGIVVGRSTFVGSGHKLGHWLGDNFSSWKQMAESIIGMLEFNLFGIPYIGADICGFFHETTTELCKRWQQLGAFYPYSRNHNQADNIIDQDPANFNDEVTYLSRRALEERYKLLPFLYTLFHRVHVEGGTVVRPLFHEFPTDEVAKGLDTQFLWGPCFMVVPILEEMGTAEMIQKKYYIPKGRWYNHYTGGQAHGDDSVGAHYTMEVRSNTEIPLFMRGGHVIPTQGSDVTTTLSRQKPFSLLVYLDGQGKATGELFLDDGDSIDTYENDNYYYAVYVYSDNVLTTTVQHNTMTPAGISALGIESLVVMGLSQRPVYIRFGETDVHNGFEYDSATGRLEVKDYDIQLTDNIRMTLEFSPQPSAEELARLDCSPDWVGQDKCLERLCIWDRTVPPPGVPRCYFDIATYFYSVTTRKELANSRGEELTLTRNSAAGSMFGGDYLEVLLRIEHLDTNLLRIKYVPVSPETPYEVPVKAHMDIPQLDVDLPVTDYRVEVDNSTGAVTVTRTDTGTVIWDTSMGGLTVAEQYLQLTVRPPTTRVYGLGENRHATYRHTFTGTTWPMFSRDQPPGGGGNLYGVHPYYLCVEENAGNSHGVLLLNSNAQEVTMGPTPSITYRTVGGVLDYYIMTGSSPEAVTARYTQLIGRPFMPAYWSLGFQLCRYGYNNISNMQAAVDRTLEAKIPYDVQYGDIDHFHENKDFTIDEQRFPGLGEYFTELKTTHNLRTIIILDPAILAVDQNYSVFTSAASFDDIMVKWPEHSTHSDINKFNSTDLHGYVWPLGPTVFPNFFKNSTSWWWKHWITTHHGNIPFDGLWIDMNEPANFGTNEERPWNWPAEDPDVWSLQCQTNGNQLDNPPYKPRSVYGPFLSDKTICMEAVHPTDDASVTYTHYDVHSLYGWSQSQPTLEALQSVTGERGIVISRSTYVNSGASAGHWLGDNDSSWSHLKDSIVGMLEFNLFGIPYIGADICGYFGDTTAELCTRWQQLGAFYPFSRNHNGMGYIDQDPAALGREVAEAARRALDVRYTLLPYLYTCFYGAHVHGTSVVRPLLHEFYDDDVTYDIDTQFLWGPGILVSPVLTEGARQVLAYFPAARWFDYYTGAEEPTQGGYRPLAAPLSHVPVHVRGGHVIPTQTHAVTTFASRQNPFGVIIAPDNNDEATGSLFWDDGVSIDPPVAGKYSLFNFTYTTLNQSYSEFDMTRNEEWAGESLPSLDNIRLLGVPPCIEVVSAGLTIDATSIKYNTETKELRISQLLLPMSGTTAADWQISFKWQ